MTNRKEYEQEIARLEHVRDGWRAIAAALFDVATGVEQSLEQFDVPPVEMIGQAGEPLLGERLRKWFASIVAGVEIAREGRQFDFLRPEDKLAVKLARSILNGRSSVASYSREYQGDGSAATTLVIRSLEYMARED